MKQRSDAPLVVKTIGHSTHPIQEFLRLLESHGVQRLVDVRTVPRSRHNPQFNRDQLCESLHAAQIDYSYMPGLGGFRRARQSVLNQQPALGDNSEFIDNSGWLNASFRGYADYMQTAEFEQNLQELIALAKAAQVCVMCAEAVPWRCHRSLIADALTVRGIEVREITNSNSERLHVLTSFARVSGRRIWYPAEEKTGT
jgi:uncharacterized protein (DUF488 family)